MVEGRRDGVEGFCVLVGRNSRGRGGEGREEG